MWVDSRWGRWNLWFKFIVKLGNVDKCCDMNSKLVKNGFDDVEIKDIWLGFFFG